MDWRAWGVCPGIPTPYLLPERLLKHTALLTCRLASVGGSGANLMGLASKLVLCFLPALLLSTPRF